MKELTRDEMAMVGGGSLYGDVAHAVGVFLGAVAATNSQIDDIGNPMLGAMQYGA